MYTHPSGHHPLDSNPSSPILEKHYLIDDHLEKNEDFMRQKYTEYI